MGETALMGRPDPDRPVIKFWKSYFWLKLVLICYQDSRNVCFGILHPKSLQAQDVNLAMEASRRSQIALAASASQPEHARHKEIIKPALDFNFQDVEGLLQIVRVAMEVISRWRRVIWCIRETNTQEYIIRRGVANENFFMVDFVFISSTLCTTVQY